MLEPSFASMGIRSPVTTYRSSGPAMASQGAAARAGELEQPSLPKAQKIECGCTMTLHLYWPDNETPPCKSSWPWSAPSPRELGVGCRCRIRPECRPVSLPRRGGVACGPERCSSGHPTPLLRHRRWCGKAAQGSAARQRAVRSVARSEGAIGQRPSADRAGTSRTLRPRASASRSIWPEP